jgi:hypothetical protein
MGILKNKKSKINYIKEHHFLFVEVPFGQISEDALKWGWAEWWPKDLALQYKMNDGDVLTEGVACKLIVKSKVLKSVLKGKMIQVRPNRDFQIEWLSGMIKGQEFVLVEERSNGMRIDYRSRYVGSNFLTQLIWVVFFRKQYNESIRQALNAFKHKVTSNE